MHKYLHFYHFTDSMGQNVSWWGFFLKIFCNIKLVFLIHAGRPQPTQVSSLWQSPRSVSSHLTSTFPPGESRNNISRNLRSLVCMCLMLIPLHGVSKYPVSIQICWPLSLRHEEEIALPAKIWEVHPRKEGLICLISYPSNDGMGWKPYSGFHNRVYERCGGIFG